MSNIEKRLTATEVTLLDFMSTIQAYLEETNAPESYIKQINKIGPLYLARLDYLNSPAKKLIDEYLNTGEIKL